MTLDCGEETGYCRFLWSALKLFSQSTTREKVGMAVDFAPINGKVLPEFFSLLLKTVSISSVRFT